MALYCPSCRHTLVTGASACGYCAIRFGEDSAWAPLDEDGMQLELDIAIARKQQLALLSAWTSFLLGITAFIVYAAGYRHSMGLSHAHRPTVGIGLSQAGAAMLSSATTGWVIAGAGVLLALVGLAVAHRRGLKLALATPALAYVSAPLWLMLVGGEGALTFG